MRQIGINSKLNQKVIAFYENNYDVVETPNFNNNHRLLKTEHGVKYLGVKSSNRVCRFCGKGKPEVTFKKIAHVFPESIGNKALASYYECDSCNELFGNGIEDAYGKYFLFYHAFSGIRGKNGTPKLKSKSGFYNAENKYTPDFEVFWEFINPAIPEESSLQIISNNPKNIKQHISSFVIEDFIQKCSPVAVYKCLVKMAISVMPFTEIASFRETIKWICSLNHENIYYPKQLLVRYEMIPGFGVTKFPHFILYRRKFHVFDKPYMLFNLTYGNFSMLLEIPRDNSNIVYDIDSIPFPPIPFHYSTEGYWDLSSKALDSNSKHSIVLNFNSIEDVTSKTEITHENGKSIINYNNK